ncbi:MAG: nucleotidyltransferase substrate binding protein [Bacteroidales bacterium]
MYVGYNNIVGPRPVIEQSFRDGYISDGKVWMRMHQSRNLASHTYNEQTAVELIRLIRSEYFSLFKKLVGRLEEEK